MTATKTKTAPQVTMSARVARDMTSDQIGLMVGVSWKRALARYARSRGQEMSPFLRSLLFPLLHEDPEFLRLWDEEESALQEAIKESAKP